MKTFQLGRTWGPVTIRGGLLQNSAGVGMDIKPLNFVEVSSEIFDMSREENPYFRAYGLIRPFQWAKEPFNWL